MTLQAQSKYMLLVAGAAAILITATPCTAREGPNAMSSAVVYVEIGGPGILYSINFEYRVTINFVLRAGYSSWSIRPFGFFRSRESDSFIGFPISLSYLYGRNADKLEIGIGIVPSYLKAFGLGEGRAILGTATIGYRFEPEEGGVLFRLDFTPFLAGRQLVPFAGASLGYAF